MIPYFFALRKRRAPAGGKEHRRAAGIAKSANVPHRGAAASGICALRGAHFAANAAAVSLQSPQSDLSVKAGLPRRLSDAEILQVTAGAVRCFWGLPEGNVLREAAYGDLAKNTPSPGGRPRRWGLPRGTAVPLRRRPFARPGRRHRGAAGTKKKFLRRRAKTLAFMRKLC